MANLSNNRKNRPHLSNWQDNYNALEAETIRQQDKFTATLAVILVICAILIASYVVFGGHDFLQNALPMIGNWLRLVATS